MAFLTRLPLPVIAAFGTGMVMTHNLLDRVNPAVFGKFTGLWLILHGYGTFWIEPGKLYFFVLWPLIPWVGVMAIGYALGALLCRSDWKTAGEVPTLISLVHSHMGITIMPLSAVKHSVASVAACNIADRIPLSEIGIALVRGLELLSLTTSNLSR